MAEYMSDGMSIFARHGSTSTFVCWPNIWPNSELRNGPWMCIPYHEAIAAHNMVISSWKFTWLQGLNVHVTVWLSTVRSIATSLILFELQELKSTKIPSVLQSPRWFPVLGCRIWSYSTKKIGNSGKRNTEPLEKSPNHNRYAARRTMFGWQETD